ncbi:hypothetical protein DXG01_013908 [Tephrocybe rancida]|nr:hypothetical protein DXG01_013908 [Tephrocybe rancida]
MSVNYSIDEFVCQAYRLFEDNKSAELAQFVLSGTDHLGRQAVIDPFLDHVDDDLYKVTRDYDSLLGLDTSLQAISTAITLFPLSKKEDTLSRSVHLSYHFTNSTGGFEAPIHKIPNLCIGKWGTHNMIRVLLPELYNEQRSPFLTQQEQITFYEKCLLPSVQKLTPNQASEWPPNYASEFFRAQNRRGQLSFTSKFFRAEEVPNLGTTLRESLAENGLTWGTGLIFLIQVRGVKHSTSHSLYSNNAEPALNVFLQQNHLCPFEIEHSFGSWWIDVGLEVISDQGNSLAWRTDSHFHVVRRLCELEELKAHRITTPGSSKYTRDLVSHLPAVSGCRISPGPQARGNFDTQYLQMYTTDKALTYRVDNSHFGKYLTCSDVLKGKSEKYLHKLYTLYGEASMTTPAFARVELRVPYKNATLVLLDIDDDFVRDSVLSIPTQTWWGLRSYRCLAAASVLQWQMDGPAIHRATELCMQLMAGLVWLLNGLHSAPDIGASSKNLIAGILPHVDRVNADPDILAYGSPTEDDDVRSDDSSDSDIDDAPRVRTRRDATTLPAYPNGLIFLRQLRIGTGYPVPRLSKGQPLTEKAFRFFFGTTLEEALDSIYKTVIVQEPHPTRVNNKRKKTMTYFNWGQQTQEPEFSLSQAGYELEPIPRDEGSDIENDGGEDEDPEATLDTVLTKLWRQGLLDFTSKVPNPRDASIPSYCVIPVADRTTITIDAYSDLSLSAYFRDCQYRVADRKEWSDLFDTLFPPKGKNKQGKTVQNYRQSQYYIQWVKLRDQSDDETFSIIRSEVRKKFNTVVWMPAAKSDRIWATKPEPGRYNKLSGLPDTLPCPQILINPKSLPVRW